jgi:hypothetical protein
MLTRDVVFEDFAQEDWLRLVGLVRDRPEPSPGGVIALTREGRLLKLLSTERGRLDPGSVAWPITAEELGKALSVRWAVVLDVEALRDLMDRWAERLRPEHEPADQAIELVRVARQLEAEGRIAAWPWRIARVPLVGSGVLVRGLDVVCPDGKAVMIGAFDQGEVFTCLVAHRRGEGFDRLVGPERLRRDMGLASGDWSRDCHRLARAAELAVGPLAIGCFAEAATWRRLLEGGRPGGFATAVATRELVLHPVGPAVAVPLGVDVGRVAYRTVRDLAHRLAATGLGGGLRPTFDRVRGALTGDEAPSVLGFEPLRLLRELLEGEPGRDDRG